MKPQTALGFRDLPWEIMMKELFCPMGLLHQQGQPITSIQEWPKIGRHSCLQLLVYISETQKSQNFELNKVNFPIHGSVKKFPEEFCIFNRQSQSKPDPNAYVNWQLLIFFDELPPGISPYLQKSWQTIFHLIDVDTDNIPLRVSSAFKWPILKPVKIDQVDFISYETADLQRTAGENQVPTSLSYNANTDYHEWHDKDWVLKYKAFNCRLNCLENSSLRYWTKTNRVLDERAYCNKKTKRWRLESFRYSAGSSFQRSTTRRALYRNGNFSRAGYGFSFLIPSNNR